MILDDLYFRNSENLEMPTEYREIRSRMKPYEEQIRQTLGFPFLDEYVNLYSQLTALTEKQLFRSGVQFTVRFLLESVL